MPLSEFDIINRFFVDVALNSGPDILLGPGDDCAVVRPRPGEVMLISTDSLSCDVHFPGFADGHQVASRALAVNLSDLAAMAAKPLAFTLALILPAVDETWLQQFSDTIKEMVQKYQIPLVGGNLSSGPLTVCVQVMGSAREEQILTRSGARPGDDIYVSGCLGDAAAALELILGNKKSGAHDAYLASRFYQPEPRLELAQRVRPFASAAIDVSDGLVADLGHLIVASGVGAELRLADIPLSPQLVADFGASRALELALGGGDDYELCFTAAPESRASILELIRDVDCPVSLIGTALQGDKLVCRKEDGSIVEPGAHSGANSGPNSGALSGYRHF